MSTVFTGSGVSVYVAVTLKHGLKMWAEHGIRPNRDWTPKLMMTRAASITGKVYKPREYEKAIRDLETWIDVHSTKARETGDIK